ncbi:hypothetical protein NOK12_16890 [Nocardioides sp. OK12]|uniref:HNH endonuclease signature motif containing protein n=1 Tax=Nocardioides sp. OK12 TaxID=2758661 RepID=UPI0021C3361E|nr:HNH endonuclease signature motif containing protein [Nocardioides sp. OK12]GHJ59171.1 hypothetical protein NOK12_16890 [Nocardioides sp. OK12]
MGYKHGAPIDRFAQKVALTDAGCLVWLACTNSTGYGTFAGGAGKTVMAHRWSYEHHVGPIPEGLHLDHLCRNRACVNPEHLEPVTVSANLLRSVEVGKSNARKTHCPSGHPYSADNVYLYSTPAKPINRLCRACRRARAQKNRENAA